MDPAMAVEVATLAKQKPMLDALAQGDSDVQRFYKNSVVFITGGSGFLGKQLIEKLLRCCQLSKMFILMRSKKEKNINERMQKLFKDPVFNTLREKQPNFCDKITAIEGDVAKIKLGINADDWKTLTEQVEVIFHGAATTRFDEPLHIATLINVRGTRETMLLGKACIKLRSYVHVSTAYSHTTPDLIGGEVQEEFYKTPAPPEAIISLVENMDPTVTNKITNDLINEWPNTYTFTKALAEELVRTTSVGLPICIVRPAIVLNTYREPSPGWLDRSCVYGAAGISVGLSAGVLNVMLIDMNMSLGYIPCDYVNNAIIVAAKETATNQAKGGNDTTIYAISSTRRNPTNMKQLYDVLDNKARYLATPKAVYYSGAIPTSNKSLFTFLSFLLHIVPAYIVDFVCAVMGKQIRLAKLTKKLCNMIYKMSYFTLNEWVFVDKKLEKLYEGLSEQDKAIFNFNIPDIDWNEYPLVMYIGLRKYIFKDGLKNTEYGNRKQIFLKFVHYVIVTICAYGLWKLFNIMFYLGTVLLTIFVK